MTENLGDNSPMLKKEVSSKTLCELIKSRPKKHRVSIGDPYYYDEKEVSEWLRKLNKVKNGLVAELQEIRKNAINGKVVPKTYTVTYVDKRTPTVYIEIDEVLALLRAKEQKRDPE